MGQRPKELTPYENLHHYWGAELRALRIARDLSLAELGTLVHCDPSYLAKIERAERPIPASLAESCDRALGTHGALSRLLALAESAQDEAKAAHPAPAHVVSDHVHVASAAGILNGGTRLPAMPDTGEEIVVPARMSDGRVVFVSVPRRAFLQSIGSVAAGLTAAPGAVTSTTRRVPSFAAADVHPVEHFQQLRQVLIDNDNLFGPRQVIPMVREQIAVMQELRSSWRGADRRDLVRVEAQYSELCGWLHQDAGEYQLAECWIDRALGLSHLAADHDHAVFVLTCKAHLANDMRLAGDAIGVGEQALHMAPPRSRLTVIAASRAAYGYALSGDHAAAQRAHDRARTLLDSIDDNPESPYGPWLNEKWVALGEAQDWTVLGDYRRAAEGFTNAIEDFPGRYHRARGVCLARTALAYAGDREVEQAATLGLDALPIGVHTGSARTLTALAQLNDQLAPWTTVPAVADFQSAVKDTICHQA